jgi:HlyD family secretion protein
LHWKRWLGIAASLAAVIIAIAYGFRPQPVLVETVKVTRGPLEVTVEEEGKTRVTDRYVISAPVASFAPRVRMEVGDRVKKGQALLLLEPPRSTVLDARSRAEAEARVAAASANLNAAEERARGAAADEAYWKEQKARIKELYESGDVPAERNDYAIAEAMRTSAVLQAAQQAVKAAQAELQSARAVLRFSASAPAKGTLEKVVLRSPVSGRVLKIVHESEGTVNAGDPLLEIADARSLEVAVDLLSADAVRVGPGTRVLLERWGGNQPLEARVRFVEPSAFTKISALGVEEQRVLVILDITAPPELWQRLGDGYRVEARFILWEAQDVLQVPNSALFRYQEKWALFSVENGVARRRIIEPGQRSGLVAQIVSGVSEGERVVTHPDASIEDGTSVKESKQ